MKPAAVAALSGGVFRKSDLRKMTAFRRAGLKTVIIPRQNEHELSKIPDEILVDMKIVLADHIHDILPVVMPNLDQSLESTV